MQIRISTYRAGNSFVHRYDARLKVLLLAAYSVALFLANTWVGMLLAVALFAIVQAASCISFRYVAGLVIPVYVLAALTVLFNSFVPASAASPDAVLLAIGLCFTPAGFARGCFFALRILLLTYASIVVSFTSTSTELSDAARWFMGPLRKLGVAVDDAAMMMSIAIRFVPLMAEELCRIRNAQWARGAEFDDGGVPARLKAWTNVLIPVFVGMFRRADALAVAMDARCYGATDARTSLNKSNVELPDVGILLLGVLACAALAAL